MGATPIGRRIIIHKTQYVGIFCKKCDEVGEHCNLYNVSHVVGMGGISREDFERAAKRSIISCEGCNNRLLGISADAEGLTIFE